MNARRLWELFPPLRHVLHTIVLVFAFLVLFHVEFDRTNLNEVTIHVAFRPHEFKFDHQGIYLIILMISASLALRVFWLKWYHHNSEVPNVLELSGAAIERLRSSSLSYDRYTLALETVTKDSFAQFLDEVDLAYPSGIVSPMTREGRSRYYRNWLGSAESFVVFVNRVDKESGAKTRVGFFAGCRVKRAFFQRLISGEYPGVFCDSRDLGNDDGAMLSFVDLKHWYIRRGTVPPEAMVWLLSRALDHLVKGGTLPVIYGHTVTSTGRAIYRALGFAHYGENALKSAQFALDGRRDRHEQPPAARWVLENLCGANSEAELHQRVYVKSLASDDGQNGRDGRPSA